MPSLRIRRSCSFTLLLLALFVPTIVSAVDNQTSAFRTISWIPREPVNGSPCLFTVQTEDAPATLVGKWQEHTISFSTNGDRHSWYALVGVDPETRPGDYNLELEATYSGGKVLHASQPVRVLAAEYKTESLHVPQKFVEPDPESLRKINLDKEVKNKAFAHEEPLPLWSGDFNPPVTTGISESFGTRRTFNGKLASVHRGLDYHAKPGTPVRAANSGEIVLARELYYEGNCVVIDHGQQFMTLYMHLSELKVREGEKVEKGQVVGLSGATGRATGPHLHVSVRWQGEYLDPSQLWALQLPAYP